MGYTVKDKVILITGANRGIGKALVDAFLSHGAKRVYAAVRNVESARNDVFASEEQRVIPIALDLHQVDSIYAAANIATDVDIVINNAGILSQTGPLDDATVDRLQEEMTVNVYGLIHVAKAFTKLLEQRNGTGILVQVNSVSSLRCAVPSVATYSASKAAAFSITQALLQELKPKGVHVVSVHPGPIATEMLTAAAVQEFQAQVEPPSKVAECLIEALTNREQGDGNDKPNPPFLVFPDERASQLGTVYRKFAKHVIEDGNMYG